MKRFPLILLICLGVACQSVSPDQRAAKARFMDQAEPVLTAVAVRLGVAPRAVPIVLLDRELPHGHAGAVFGGRILISQSAIAHPNTRFVLAHEAVHALMPAELELLPAAVQEGLCDWIAMQVVSEGSAARMHFLQASFPGLAQADWGHGPAAAFELSRQQLFELDDPIRRQFAYSIGFSVASRLGLVGLTEVCREARAAGRDRVPTAILCARAGLSDTTAAGWLIDPAPP